MIQGEETFYFSIDSLSHSVDNQSLGINPRYAQCLGIEENSIVSVSEVQKPGTVKSLIISAKDEDDYNVLVISVFLLVY